MSEELSCLLRRLTLCDGQHVVAVSSRTPERWCYCERLEQALDRSDDQAASEARSDRARAVAQSDRLISLRDARARLADW